MSRYTILIVDDEKLILDIISKASRIDKYRVLTADSAEEGMVLLEMNNIDLVISDHQMPGMSGIQFLQHVRTTYPDVLTILLTGYASLETAMEAINSAGVYKFLTKPFDINELLITIKRAFEVKDLVRERNLLMNKVRSYESRLDELEKEYPGITHVVRDANGEIITDI
ncbi:MAG: response regulator [Pseudomonadota bacterium]